MSLVPKRTPIVRSVVNWIFIILKTRRISTIVWFHGGGMEGGNKFIPQRIERTRVCSSGGELPFESESKEPAYRRCS